MPYTTCLFKICVKFTFFSMFKFQHICTIPYLFCGAFPVSGCIKNVVPRMTPGTLSIFRIRRTGVDTSMQWVTAERVNLTISKVESLPRPRWWQLKYFFMFTPKIGEDEPILTSIFFKWVGSTTNQWCGSLKTMCGVGLAHSIVICHHQDGITFWGFGGVPQTKPSFATKNWEEGRPQCGWFWPQNQH